MLENLHKSLCTLFTLIQHLWVCNRYLGLNFLHIITTPRNCDNNQNPVWSGLIIISSTKIYSTTLYIDPSVTMLMVFPPSSKTVIRLTRTPTSCMFYNSMIMKNQSCGTCSCITNKQMSYMYQMIWDECYLLHRTNLFIIKSMREGPIDMHFKMLMKQ